MQSRLPVHPPRAVDNGVLVPGHGRPTVPHEAQTDPALALAGSTGWIDLRERVDVLDPGTVGLVQ